MLFVLASISEQCPESEDIIRQVISVHLIPRGLEWIESIACRNRSAQISFLPCHERHIRQKLNNIGLQI